MAKAPSGYTKTFLDEVNASRKGKDRYTSLRDYYTDKGRFAADSKQFANRKADFENKRGVSKRTQIVVSGEFLNEARKLYGAAVDLYNIPELKTLFENAFIKDMDPADFLREVDNTEWARTRTQSQERFDVLKATNPLEANAEIDRATTTVNQVLSQKGISVTPDQVRVIAEKGIRNGWQGNQWDEYTSSEALTVATPKPATTQTQGAPQVAAMPTATALRQIAKQYGVKVSDTTLNGWVSDIATNRRSQEQFEEDVRVSAKTLYPSIADRLDTSTFEQITAPYKQMYADILETSEDNVDLTSPVYSNLFSVGEPGKQRMMSATEWAGFLRRRPEWQNTQNAYKEYAQAAQTLNKIFGGTR